MKLKQLPEDFIVKETADYKLGKKGKYAYFVLKKKNWTTINAIQKTAEFLRKNPKIFNTSGMKDKDAVTEQYVSAYGLRREDIEKVAVKDIKVFFKGYSNEQIKIGSLTGNYFEITARALDKPLSEINSVCNYYDDQRFGGIRPNMAKVGELIVKRQWENAMKHYLLHGFDTETEKHKLFRKELENNWGKLKAGIVPNYLTEKAVAEYLAKNPSDYIGAFKQLPKQILTLFIHAYQSKLFNEMLDTYVRKNCKEYKEADYCLGKLAMCNTELKVKLPLAGYDFDIEDVDENVKEIVKSVLKEIDLKQFSFPELPFLSSRTVMREASVELKDLRLEKAEKDELNKGRLKQKVFFILQKGSFATMALKAME
ncbi:MAG: tRNA pseudouridine(13) synthase TruD [Nanoarchaeota archaeon]|nr:tRNA pseudouridine(13) synthase TruD [Nanoarchaeota archaeon]